MDNEPIIPLEKLPREILAEIFGKISNIQEKCALREVCSWFNEALGYSCAWSTVTLIDLKWDGNGGMVMLNQQRTRKLEYEEFFDTIEWLLPLVASVHSLRVHSTVQQKTESYISWIHTRWFPSDDFWQTLVTILERCPFAALISAQIDVGKLGIPADISLVTRVIDRLQSVLDTLEITIYWDQFGGLTNFRQLLSGIKHAENLHNLTLLISKQWMPSEDVDADEIYAELTTILCEKTLRDFRLKTEFTPTMSAMLQLVNCLAPHKLKQLHLNVPYGDGYDFMQFWDNVIPDVFSELTDLEFNLRVMRDLLGDWVTRVPSVCPKLKFMRTDYVNIAPISAEELRQAICEWYWTLGANDANAYWWPVLKEVDLESALRDLRAIMRITIVEEIGSKLCWVYATGPERKLNVCLKRL